MRKRKSPIRHISTSSKGKKFVKGKGAANKKEISFLAKGHTLHKDDSGFFHIKRGKNVVYRGSHEDVISTLRQSPHNLSLSESVAEMNSAEYKHNLKASINRKKKVKSDTSAMNRLYRV